jgi:hypothetical protein
MAVMKLNPVSLRYTVSLCHTVSLENQHHKDIEGPGYYGMHFEV